MRPSGCPISVIRATVRVPAASAVATISAARYSASSRRRRNAPEPVPVRSRSAYSTRSAGTSAGVWLTIAAPHRARTVSNSSSESADLKPGIASSLSRVPPVCPSARPLIMGTASPQAAASGATRKLVLSPTPPVECLSTATLPSRDGSNFSPESRMATVRARVSSTVSPCSHAAISHAASCSCGIVPSAAPAARNSISRASSALPSRFLRMRSIMCSGAAAFADISDWLLDFRAVGILAR